MKRLDETMVDKIILSVHLINQGASIAVLYSDGSVEFRDRTNFAVISPDGDLDTVTSMSQSGFSFPFEESCQSQI